MRVWRSEPGLLLGTFRLFRACGVEKNAAPKTAVREYNVSAKSYIRNPNVGILH